MRFFICDDDKSVQKTLREYVNEYISKKKLKDTDLVVFSSGEDMLASDLIPDIVLLDVEMNDGISGIQAGRKLKSKYPKVRILIVTSHLGYIDDTFRFSFFRFLDKPVNKYQLFRNLNDALFQHAFEVQEIVIETKDKTRVLHAQDIMCVKTHGRKSVIYTKNEDILNLQNITHWKNTLKSSCFFQSHRDCIVNLRYVLEFNHVEVTLSYGKTRKITAYLAQRKHSDFKNAFLWFREQMQ